MTHEGEADERHGQHKVSHELRHGIDIDAVSTDIDVDEEGGRGDGGEQHVGVGGGEIDEPVETPGLHGLHGAA